MRLTISATVFRGVWLCRGIVPRTKSDAVMLRVSLSCSDRLKPLVGILFLIMFDESTGALNHHKYPRDDK